MLSGSKNPEAKMTVLKVKNKKGEVIEVDAALLFCHDEDDKYSIWVIIEIFH